ncbi:tyrosine-type recombinase/integrase [Candidatus Bathyarchaeota archaeon A05DMB-2]|nr:tyrosine-type recombinase/integrase [Candidatus Bathyarchaeota archaeon A05DMB-2]MBT0160432.1 tyrosine-type recombinase/integrase [Candidatus Bathyarchaeota archaeon A05DMB-2]
MAEPTPENGAFGDKASSNDGKLPTKEDTGTSPLCPRCGSNRIYRDGMRYLTNGESVQRWLCRDCNYRFSQTQKQNKPSQKSSEWNLITASNFSLEHQERSESHMRGARTLQIGGLNLVTSGTRQETAQREGTTQLTDKTGKIVEFLWNLSQNGVQSNTLGSYGAVLRKLAKNTDLTPEAVKEYLAKDKEWNEATKAMAVIVYGSFLKFNNLSWQPPKYKPVDKAPFIPTEADIDQLISGSGRILATFLQFLKETGARCGEVAKLKWSDIDFERKIVRITPEKGSRARVLPISRKLIDMLSNHSRQTEKVFATLYSLKSNFYKTRKSIAFKLQNPRLKEIGLHTFRHWKATMEYHKTKDILHVQQVLGHRDLRNTLIYINLEKALFQNADDEFHVKVAHNLDEACKLLEVGFEYIAEIDGARVFRKRK